MPHLFFPLSNSSDSQVGFPLFLDDIQTLRYIRFPCARLFFDMRDRKLPPEPNGEKGESSATVVAFEFTGGEEALQSCLSSIQNTRTDISVEEGLPPPLSCPPPPPPSSPISPPEIAPDTCGSRPDDLRTTRPLTIQPPPLPPYTPSNNLIAKVPVRPPALPTFKSNVVLTPAPILPCDSSLPPGVNISSCLDFQAKSRSGNASSTIAPSPSIPAPHTPSVPPSRAASTSLGALGAATTAGVVPKAGRGTKKAVTSDVAGPRLASLGSEPSKRKRHRSSATGRVGGSTAAASEAPDRVLSGGVAGMEAILAGLGGAAEPSSASASLLYMLRNAKPMVQQQVMR